MRCLRHQPAKQADHEAVAEAESSLAGMQNDLRWVTATGWQRYDERATPT
jgi:hypothetical protein